MLFNSYFFILIFLPLCVLGYYLLLRLSGRVARLFLLGMSLWFYGYYRPDYLPIILASIAVNAALSKMLLRLKDRTARIPVLILGLAFNISLIGYYKYAGFLVWNFNLITGADFTIPQIALPLGISFFTFQQISFLIDSFRGEAAGYSLLEYPLFVTFFPQLVAGPIVRHDELIPQFREESRQKPDTGYLLSGLMRFSLGLAKKVLIADLFGEIVTWGFSDTSALTSAETWVVMLAYTLQIYYDFSGYSDMAIGLGRLFHLDLPQNFDLPYRSLSLQDFWRRWHMTLTRFLTSYLYIPLGGNRKGKLRTCRNILIVFLVSGLWHGANYTFILWGLLHGVGVMINRLFADIGRRIPGWIKWPVNFLIINILWLLFRADGVRQWFSLLRKLCFLDGPIGGVSPDLCTSVGSPAAFLLCSAVALALCTLLPDRLRDKYRQSTPVVIGTAVLLFISLFSLGKESIFLYFNF